MKLKIWIGPIALVLFLIDGLGSGALAQARGTLPSQDGSLLRVRTAKVALAQVTTGRMTPRGLATFATGGYAISGSFCADAVFGLGESNETVLLNYSGQGDGFLARYQSNGRLLWARAIASPRSNSGNAVAAMDNGDCVLGGSFGGTITLGLGEPNETILTSSPTASFLARYDSAGALLWAKLVAEPSASVGAVKPFSDGSILAAGSFFNSATFGLGEINETTLVSQGDADMFRARFDSDGTLLWARSDGDARHQQLFSASVLPDDSFLVGGTLLGPTTFDLGGPNEITLPLGGVFGNSVLVAKYDSAGNFLWATSSDANLTLLAGLSEISSRADGTSIITGSFIGSITLGLGEPNETTLSTSNTLNDAFVASFDEDGLLLWAKNEGSTDRDNASSALALEDGSCLVAGQFAFTTIFGLGDRNETTLTARGYDDHFLARYEADGSLRWAKRIGSPTDDGTSVKLARSRPRAFLMAGSWGSGLVLGEGEFKETTLIHPFAPLPKFSFPAGIFHSKHRLN